jgi:hypothetical protein
MAPRRMSVIDRTGHTYGKLTVIKRLDNIETKNGPVTQWLCRCECGTEKAVRGPSLAKTANGKQGTRSCGRCGVREWGTTHGKSHSKIYKAWSTMLQRCGNPNHTYFKHYGGRGIAVCERWQSFENFFEDMGNPPAGCTLDRIDNSKGYSKGNCRWASKKMQGNNRRSNIVLEYKGQSMTVTQWGEVTGLGKQIIRNRLARGWTVEQALTTEALPFSRSNPTKPFHGTS